MKAQGMQNMSLDELDDQLDKLRKEVRRTCASRLLRGSWSRTLRGCAPCGATSRRILTVARTKRAGGSAKRAAKE